MEGEEQVSLWIYTIQDRSTWEQTLQHSYMSMVPQVSQACRWPDVQSTSPGMYIYIPL